MSKKRILTEAEKIKIQEAKEELRNYKKEIEYIKEKEDDIEEIRELLEKTTTRFSKTKTSNNNMCTDKFSDGIDKLNELKKEIPDKLYKLLKKKFEIDSKIEQLEQPYKNILFYRYARGKSWNSIAKYMGYTVDYVYDLHGEALYLYSKV